mgnify:CR=1 FL=1
MLNKGKNNLTKGVKFNLFFTKIANFLKQHFNTVFNWLLIVSDKKFSFEKIIV